MAQRRWLATGLLLLTNQDRGSDVREREMNGRREKRRDGREAHLVVNDDGVGQRRARGWDPVVA